jgi:ubiquinone/menaquinone biosynthesis C-methylase UbiE
MKPSEELDLANYLSYKEDYEKIVNSGSWLSKWIYKKSHSTLEEFTKGKSLKSILELGAQSDQHRKFVSHEYLSYVVSDINTELLNQGSEFIGSDTSPSEKLENKKVVFQKIDAGSIPYPDDSFDRVIATCLIAHMTEPADVMYEWRRVVRNGGQIDFYVALEPGMLLRFARSITHKRVKRNSKYRYDLLEYSQHKNHFPAIREFVNFVFSQDQISRKFFPFKLPSWNLNLWVIYSVHVRK